jgi:hypothetical protein
VIFDLPRRLAAEALGTALLLAAVIGSGIMAESLAGGNGISVTLHAAGIHSLVAELVDQEAPVLAASEPLLEAAE